MIVDMEKVPSGKVGKPFERELKVVLSPDLHDEVRGFTLIESILAPNGGCTDFHAHSEAGELMIFMSGRAKAIVDGGEHEITPGMVLYAPPGVEHKTVNIGSEPVKIACVFVPAISTEYISKSIEEANRARGE